MRILFFGDSTTYGAWDTGGGWVDRLKLQAHKQTIDSQGSNKIQVINLGIGGDTSSDILKRMSAEVEARVSPSWPLALVFCFGCNDQRTVNGQLQATLEQFEANTKEIISRAKEYTNKILFVGSPPLGLQTVVFKDKEYSDSRLAEYDSRLEFIVKAAGLEFIPLRPIFDYVGQAGLFSYDNIHPNDNGHELISTAVSSKLKALGWYG